METQPEVFLILKSFDERNYVPRRFLIDCTPIKLSRSVLDAAWERIRCRVPKSVYRSIGRLSGAYASRMYDQIHLCGEMYHATEVVLVEYRYGPYRFPSILALSGPACKLLAEELSSDPSFDFIEWGEQLQALRGAMGAVGQECENVVVESATDCSPRELSDPEVSAPT